MWLFTVITPYSVEFTNQCKAEIHDKKTSILSKVHFPVIRGFYEKERTIAMG